MTHRSARAFHPLATASFAALLFVAGGAGASLTQIVSQLVVSGLTAPVFATAPAGDPRLFVVEQAGRIRIVENGAIQATHFLDITAKVSSTGERGLLGLAFDPDYAVNGRFFVYYTDLAGDSVLSRFQVSANPDVANPSETVILFVDQPFSNHNGGTVAFGPDGFLYLGLGDGGSGNDPAERAQNLGELLGKMLRLDVGVPAAPDSLPGPGGAYAIPASNPFVGVAGARAEIWALGLRNPYRFSFDRLTGDLWIGDVGQNAREEVDFEAADDPGGRNYGWDIEEGFLCNPNDPAPAPPCGSPLLTPPVHDYPNGGSECSVTGGVVHRGTVPGVQGEYLFGDYCSGRVWTLDADFELRERSAELGTGGGLAAFAEDGFGETYLVLRTGTLHRIVAAPPECGDGIDNDGDGDVDTADAGCFDAAWPEEDPACNDGEDDDGDGLVDLADPDCTAPWMLSESTPGGCAASAASVAGLLALPLARGARRRRRAGRRSASGDGRASSAAC